MGLALKLGVTLGEAVRVGEMVRVGLALWLGLAVGVAVAVSPAQRARRNSTAMMAVELKAWVQPTWSAPGLDGLEESRLLKLLSRAPMGVCPGSSVGAITLCAENRPRISASTLPTVRPREVAEVEAKPALAKSPMGTDWFTPPKAWA